MLDTSTWITLQQNTTKQKKAMGEETSTKLRSSVRAKENGRDRGGTSPSTGSPAPHTPSSSTSGPSSHATLAYVFLFLLVDLLGFTVILPLIPSLLEYYDKHDEVGFNKLLLTCTSHEYTQGCSTIILFNVGSCNNVLKPCLHVSISLWTISHMYMYRIFPVPILRFITISCPAPPNKLINIVHNHIQIFVPILYIGWTLSLPHQQGGRISLIHRSS